MQKIFVTGANGFVGSHIVASLCKRGYAIVASDISFVNLNPILKKLGDQIFFQELDMLEFPDVNAILERHRPDVLINSAAYGVDYRQQDSVIAAKVNVEAPVRMFELSAKLNVARFVHIGSAYEYGNKNHPLSEDEPLEPIGIYGASKAAGSLFLIERAKSLSLELNILRPFGMWGPGEGHHKFVPQLISSIRDGRAFKMSKGEQLRDYVYIKDMANWIVALSMRRVDGGILTINLGSGMPIKMKELALAVARELRGEKFVQVGALPYRANEMMTLVADISQQKQILGEPALTPISEGVREMIAEGAV